MDNGKDDFKAHFSFGEDQFGAPRWREIVGLKQAAEYHKQGTVHLMLDLVDAPGQRGFIHVSDVASAVLAAIDHPKARQQTLNITMDEPLNYGVVANSLKATRGFPSVAIQTDMHSTWLDNSKAKFLLGWRPKYDTQRLVDAAYSYERAAEDPRVTWYPS